MGVPVYIINLDRNPERLEAAVSSASSVGVELIRVPAINGQSLSPQELAAFDNKGFAWRHGRTPLAGEVGCYMSHLHVLDLAAERPDACFVVLEDDVVFTDKFPQLVSELSDVDGWDIVKLVNHRFDAFVPGMETAAGVKIGRCIFGPLGSAAAYLVRKDAIDDIRAMLTPMSLPYDVALERGWAGNVRVFTTNEPVVTIDRKYRSSIGGRVTYRNTKFPFYRRIGALLFRTSDLIRRLAYVVRPMRLRPRGESAN